MVKMTWDIKDIFKFKIIPFHSPTHQTLAGTVPGPKTCAVPIINVLMMFWACSDD